MKKSIEIILFGLAIILLIISSKFDSAIRIDLIFPISIGLIFLSTLIRISEDNSILSNIVIALNSIGFVGAYFYFMHWPFGYFGVVIWLFCRLYVNYEIFIDSNGLLIGRFKRLNQIVIFLSLIQIILTLKTHWLTAGITSWIMILLFIFTTITIFNKDNKSWIKDYIYQLWIQNTFLLIWLINMIVIKNIK